MWDKVVWVARTADRGKISDSHRSACIRLIPAAMAPEVNLVRRSAVQGLMSASAIVDAEVLLQYSFTHLFIALPTGSTLEHFEPALTPR